MNSHSLAALLWFGSVGVSLAGSIFWTDRATGARAVRRMGLNGSAATTTVPLIGLAGSADPRGIAVDAAAGKLYFGSNSQILQANLDGTGTVAKVAGLTAVRDVKFDEPSGYLYWADQTAGNLQRALVSDFVVSGGYAKVASDSYYLDIYRGAGNFAEPMILWGNSAGSYWVTSTNVALTGASSAYSGGNNVRGVCVDGPNQMIYWNEKDAKMVRRAKLKANLEIDLTTVQNLYTGLNAPHGLVLDLGARKLYWVDSGTNGSTGFGRSGVNRGDMDGSGAAEALIGPTSTVNSFSGQPWDLDLDVRCGTFAEWQARFFRNDALTSQTGTSADPDSDGLSNWAEYALGSPPLGSNPEAPSRALVVQDAGQSFPAIESTRRSGASDVTYLVQVAEGTSGWLDNVSQPVPAVTVEVSSVSVGEGMVRVVTRSTKPLEAAGKQFLRVVMNGAGN